MFTNISRLLKFSNIRLVPSFPNKLDRIIRLGKDITDKLNRPNCVYKLTCTSCSSTYVGETKRRLQKRIEDHQGNDKKSIVYLHCRDNDHDMDWSGIRILDRESVWEKRRISEALHIGNSHNSLNRKEDSYKISRVYKNFIRAISKNR